MSWFDGVKRALSGLFNRGTQTAATAPGTNPADAARQAQQNVYSPPPGHNEPGHVRPASSGTDNAAHNAADYQRLRAQLAAQQQALGPEPRAQQPAAGPVYIPMQPGPGGTQVPLPLPQQNITARTFRLLTQLPQAHLTPRSVVARGLMVGCIVNRRLSQGELGQRQTARTFRGDASTGPIMAARTIIQIHTSTNSSGRRTRTNPKIALPRRAAIGARALSAPFADEQKRLRPWTFAVISSFQS